MFTHTLNMKLYDSIPLNSDDHRYSATYKCSIMRFISFHIQFIIKSIKLLIFQSNI